MKKTVKEKGQSPAKPRDVYPPEPNDVYPPEPNDVYPPEPNKPKKPRKAHASRHPARAFHTTSIAVLVAKCPDRPN
jgi:hypothetical protein